MSQLDLNQLAGEKLTPDGVTPITVGALICAQAREQFRALLKQAAPERYQEYRSIKYPAGEGSATPETRRDATRFLFDAARDLLAPHYVSTAE